MLPRAWLSRASVPEVCSGGKALGVLQSGRRGVGVFSAVVCYESVVFI